jgi:hypothetical protein
MLIREFISKENKSQMITTLLKHYKVGNVKVKMKSMKNHAHYNVDTGTLELSTRYKTIKSSQVKQFLITILHEIYHAMDSKKYGWKKFKEMYEMEMNLMIAKNKDVYDDNKFEIEAEDFGQKNWKKWQSKFKRENLI